MARLAPGKKRLPVREVGPVDETRPARLAVSRARVDLLVVGLVATLAVDAAETVTAVTWPLAPATVPVADAIQAVEGQAMPLLATQGRRTGHRTRKATA